MKIKITGKEYNLPDRIKVGQMLLVDLRMLMRYQEGKIDLTNLEEFQPFLQWLTSFLKVLGEDIENDDFEQLIELMRSPQFGPWLQGLFGNLGQSTS